MGVVVTPTVAACDELWYDPALFQSRHSNLEEEEAETIVREATKAIWMMTGQRFHGVQCLREVYEVRASQATLTLDKHPVREVQNVYTTDSAGTTTESISFTQMADGAVSITPQVLDVYGYMGCANGVAYLKVEYSIEQNLPPGADRVVLRLADEFFNHMTGKNCALPETTSVSRQGMSWTIYNPEEFIERGQTGITMIDQFVGMANRKGFLTLIDPLKTGRLMSSTVLSCGSDCED